MINLSVNKPYPLPLPPNLTDGGEGATVQFLTKSANTLQIILNNMSKDEIKDIKKGEIRAGFLYEKGNILWLFQIFKHNKKQEIAFQFDCQFNINLLDKDQRALHDITNEHQRLSIDVHVIDNNIVKALRVVTMSNSLTIEFLSVVQEQLTTIVNSSVIEKWMNTSIGDLIKNAKMQKLGT
jgi:hypothetical protein